LLTALKILQAAGPAESVALSRDGNTVAIGGSDGDMSIRDMATGTAFGDALRSEHGAITSLQFTDDGQLLSGSSDGTAERWDTATGGRTELPKPAGEISVLALSQAGERIAYGGTDGTIHMWQAQVEPKQFESFGSAHGAVTALAFSPDGQRLVSAHQNGVVQLWNSTQGRTEPN
jgi:WD40 repeat protein